MSGERGDCYASEMTIREKLVSQAFCVLLEADQRDSGLGFRKDLTDVKCLARSARVAADVLLAELAKPQEPTP